MGRIRMIALTLMLPFGVPAVRSAHGQVLTSSTPQVVGLAPTAIPTSMPTGPALLERMRKAIVAHRTVRVNVTAVTTWKGHKVFEWMWIDLDLQANAMREVDTILRTKPKAPTIAVTVERRELVVSGGMAADRKPKGLWSCEQLSGVRVKNTLIPFQIRAPNVRNLGAAHVAGLPVWHLEVDRAEVAVWSAHAATVGLYISQSNNSLVQLNLNAVTWLGGAKTHETVTETYRRYGKPIAVTIPAQCG